MKLLVSVGIISLVFFSSCAPAYLPPQVNVPLLTEAGEAKISASGDWRSLNVQGSYAITDHLAISAGYNGFSFPDSGTLPEEDDIAYGFSRGNQFDIAPGVYWYLYNDIVLELYGGYGLLNAKSDQIEGNLHKFHLQPSIGFIGHNYESSLSVRFVELVADRSAVIESGESELYTFFIEPVTTFSIGRGPLKLSTQMGFSIPIENSSLTSESIKLDHRHIVFNVGLLYTFSNR